MSQTFIIAEAGANHNKDYRQALSLVDIAVEAGASAVKFQTYTSETLYSKYTPDFGGYKNIPKLIKNIELPRAWQKKIKHYCDDKGIEFMSTPFDEKAVDELYEMGVKRLKIAGFEASDPRFVKYVASTKLPLIISAGIGIDLEMIGDIISWVHGENTEADITILHCNNAYPTPISDINLLQIPTIIKQYPDITVGLSDHTEGILVPPLAVSLGAKCIEKHYTISQRLPGPDHSFAIEPQELKKMIENIKSSELALSVQGTKFTDSELHFRKAMRSVVAKIPVKKGDIYTVQNLTTKRPFLENSVAALDYYKLIGEIAKQDMVEDTILTKDMV